MNSLAQLPLPPDVLDWLEEYAVPILVSLLLHVLLLILLSSGGQHAPEIEKINTPNYVKAQLVKLSPQTTSKPKPPPKQATKPKPPPKTTQVDKAKEQEKARQAQLQREKERAEQKRLEEEKRKQAEAKRKEEERLKEQQRKAEAERQQAERKAAEQQRAREEAFALAMAEEEAYKQAVTDSEIAQSYAHLIKQRVEQNWSRPPSAKYGMQVLLEIQMVPTGHVVAVNVLESSGNDAFDLSARKAVTKVERFIEIKDMPGRIFEQHFRRFKLLFRPDDKLS